MPTPTSSCPIPDSGVCAATGFAEESGMPDADGAHPQPLRRPHLHPAAAGDPALQRQDQAEPGAQHPRGPARHPDRRLDRARHDQPEDREDGAAAGAQRGPHAHRLPADDLAVLLRRRHAEPLRAHRRDPHARADPRLHRGRHARVPEPRRAAARGRRREQRPYCTSCYTGVYPVAFPRDEQAYLQLALKAVD